MEKVRRFTMDIEESEFSSPRQQYFNSLCSLLRGNKNVFKWIFTKNRWTSKWKEVFLKEEVIVANNLLSMSPWLLHLDWNFWRSSRCYRKMTRLKSSRVRLKKGKFAIWYMECWSTIILWFLWKSSIPSSQISFFCCVCHTGKKPFFVRTRATNSECTF